MKMMNRYFFFTSLLLNPLFSVNNYAQTIQTAKDSAVFIDCAKLPQAAGEYNVQYNMISFDLNYVEDKEQAPKTPKSLEEMLNDLDNDPKSLTASMALLYKYKTLQDQANYETYLYYSYKQALRIYQADPDNFEVVEKLLQLFGEVQNTKGAIELLENYISTHPNDTRGYVRLALQKYAQGDLERTQEPIQQAYKIDPLNYEIYFAAGFSESLNILNQVGSILKTKTLNPKTLKTIAPDPTFFREAILNGDPQLAQMGLDLANIFTIYYRTVLSTTDKILGEEVIKISLTPSDKKVLNAIEKRALKQLDNKLPNLEFAYTTLFYVEFLRGNDKKAIEHWTNSGSLLDDNQDIPRLIAFLYLSRMDFEKAIEYTNKALVINPNYEDYYILGRLYSYQKDWELAYLIFEETRLYYPANHRAVCAKVAARIHQHKFGEAFELLSGYSKEITDNIDQHHINYYTALATLASGDKNDAFKRLKAIHAESEYKSDAEKLLAHFFKSEEEN